jgi:preprotein translocase subunit SecG
MQTVLIVIHLLIAIALIGVVLLQRSEGGALGMGGGGGSGAGFGGMFSPRGAASTLTRTTAILAFCFLVTSMSLTFLSLGGTQNNSLFGVDPGAPGAPPTLPTGGAPPTLPAAPADAAPAPATPGDLAPAGPPSLPAGPPSLPEN